MKKIIIFLVVITLVINFTSINIEADNFLKGEDYRGLEELTSRNLNAPIYELNLYFIHPEIYVRYNFEPHYINHSSIEENLQEEYDIILIENLTDEDNILLFRFYDFKHSVELIVDGAAYEAIDYYDFYPHLGYLLFPKVIDIEEHQEIALEIDYDGEYTIEWNIQQIDQMINILK